MLIREEEFNNEDELIFATYSLKSNMLDLKKQLNEDKHVLENTEKNSDIVKSRIDVLNVNLTEVSKFISNNKNGLLYAFILLSFIYTVAIIKMFKK